MYDVKSNLVIGYHGCDAAVRDELLLHPKKIKFSKKPYDWLGHGVYFWENDYERALQWAKDKKARGRIAEPAVLGATLQLRCCCDFLESRFINLLAGYYEAMKIDNLSNGNPLPENKDAHGDPHKDKLLRFLDCAVIEYMHSMIRIEVRNDYNTKGFTNFKVFDSLRGAFLEGAPVFEGSGIFEKAHIQICIRNPECIIGLFKPCDEQTFQQETNSFVQY